MKTLVLTRAAQQDLLAARSWYDAQREGLGVTFELALDATLTRIQRMPLAHAAVTQSIRRAVVRRFPYDVVVLLIFHTSQDPARALRRLTPN